MNTNPGAIRVLFYGDSNTWGHLGRGPYRIHNRYPVVVQNVLGRDYEIIEAGLGGRTVAGENAYGLYRDGLRHFGAEYGQHMPLDLLGIMLGSNDANFRLRRRPEDIADDLHGYFATMGHWAAKGFVVPPTLIISPPPITEASLAPDEEMYRGGEAITQALPPLYRAVAAQHDNAYFFEAGSVASTGPADGVHLNEVGHLALGVALAEQVRLILEGVSVK